MVYHICNRILFRGFNTYTGKTKILKSNGNTARGQWIAGQLVEIQTKAMAPEKPVEPILCLAAPGKRIDMISARAVIPSTISQFTGFVIDRDWNLLTKTQQTSWLKNHTASEWKGTPIFEGDIFYHRLDKKYYVVTFNLQTGFHLENLMSGGEEPLRLDLLYLRGNLWQLPKDITPEEILRFHKRRGTQNREEGLVLL